MKTIGILGAGRRGMRLAKACIDVGLQVVLGSRHVSRTRRITESLGREGITPGSYGDVVAAPIVLPALLSHDKILVTIVKARFSQPDDGLRSCNADH